MSSEMDRDELAQRTVYAALRGVAQLALASRPAAPLKETARFLDLAFFHVLRDRGLPIREVAERLHISPSTAAILSRELKQIFSNELGGLALGRRIQFALWAEPLSLARLCQTLDDVSQADIEQALDTLLADGRVQELPGRTVRYETQRSSRIVRDQLLARLDGVGQFVSATQQAIFARFFRPESFSFARVLSLRVRPQDRERLQKLYEEVIWPELVAIDAAAEADPQAQAIEFTLSWSPYETFTQKDGQS